MRTCRQFPLFSTIVTLNGHWIVLGPNLFKFSFTSIQYPCMYNLCNETFWTSISKFHKNSQTHTCKISYHLAIYIYASIYFLLFMSAHLLQIWKVNNISGNGQYKSYQIRSYLEIILLTKGLTQTKWAGICWICRGTIGWCCCGSSTPWSTCLLSWIIMWSIKHLKKHFCNEQI